MKFFFKIFLQTSFILLGTIAKSQIVKKTFPKNYFINPVKIPLQLSANFGDLRKEHFHMGLDVRTQQKENIPVFATADGYVSRIKIERFGYGRAIYIKHKNGYTTLYAHLNNFYTTLHEFVKNKQYAEQKWEQDFELEPNQFVVKQGQFIAFSGNTGGSEGAHLHFEIRDEEGLNVNPQLLGYKVFDNTPPKVFKVFLYNRNISTYKQNVVDVDPKKQITEVFSNKISIGVIATDIINKSTFKFGIHSAEVWVNGKKEFAFELNNFSYDDTRYINAVIDYKEWYDNDRKIYHLSKLPANKVDIYDTNFTDGIISLQDTLPKKIQLKIYDFEENVNTINFTIKLKDTLKSSSNSNSSYQAIPNQKNNFALGNCTIFFDEKAFYDTVNFAIKENSTLIENMVSKEYELPLNIPVHNYYQINIPLNKSLTEEQKKKVIAYLKNKKYTDIKNVTWVNNIATASFKRLGNIALMLDTVAPKIEPIGWKNNTTFISQKKLTIRVTDNFSELTKVKVFLNENWLLLSRKGSYLTYEFDDKITLGNHQLNIFAEDEAGNITNNTYNITYKKK